MWPLDNVKQEAAAAHQKLPECPRCGASTKLRGGLFYPKIECKRCGLLITFSTSKNEVILVLAPTLLLLAFIFGAALL